MATYTPDTKALDSKRQELEMLLADFATRYPEISRVSTNLFDEFIRITAPEDPPSVIEYISVTVPGPGRAPRARSRKPGNIRFNWKILFESIPDAAFAIAAPIPQDTRFLLPFAALWIWNELWKSASVDLQRTDSPVLLTL